MLGGACALHAPPKSATVEIKSSTNNFSLCVACQLYVSLARVLPKVEALVKY